MIVTAKQKIPVGISACLLGDPVRYDGGHRQSAYCTDTLSARFEFRRCCPEVAIGLGVPRNTIRIVAHGHNIAVEPADGSANFAPALTAHARQIIEAQPDLCGFIVKARSPSCGMLAVKQFDNNGVLLNHNGVGAFTRELQRLAPWLPVEEDERLLEASARESFIARVEALYARLSVNTYT